jgi:hypothetical protein
MMSEATADLIRCLNDPNTAIKIGMKIKVIFAKDGKAEKAEVCPDQPAPEEQPDPIVTRNPAPVTTEQLKETCTSPAAAPVNPAPERKKGPAEECRMPTREELLAMVYNYDTYWKAKTLMDVQAHDEIRQQVEFKNWQEAVSLAITYHQRCEDGLSTEEDLKIVFSTATAIHGFIRSKAGGA